MLHSNTWSNGIISMLCCPFPHHRSSLAKLTGLCRQLREGAWQFCVCGSTRSTAMSIQISFCDGPLVMQSRPALRPPQTFEKISEFLSERLYQRCIPKPQFWYSIAKVWISVPASAFLGFWICKRFLGFSVWGQFMLERLSPTFGSQHQHQLRIKTPSQGREIRIPVPGPRKIIHGGKITGTNDFAYISRK